MVSEPHSQPLHLFSFLRQGRICSLGCPETCSLPASVSQRAGIMESVTASSSTYSEFSLLSFFFSARLGTLDLAHLDKCLNTKLPSSPLFFCDLASFVQFGFVTQLYFVSAVY